MSITHDILAGVGLQVFDIDITGSDIDLIAAIAGGSTVRCVVYNDDSGVKENSYSASGPATVGDPGGTSEVVYSEDVLSAGVDVTHIFFKFSHNFTSRGDYFVSVSIEDSASNRTSAYHAIKIGIGDGLPNHIKV